MPGLGPALEPAWWPWPQEVMVQGMSCLQYHKLGADLDSFLSFSPIPKNLESPTSSTFRLSLRSICFSPILQPPTKESLSGEEFFYSRLTLYFVIYILGL